MSFRHGAQVLALSLAACSSDNSNAAGDYTVEITNRDNGCGVTSWTTGRRRMVVVPAW